MFLIGILRLEAIDVNPGEYMFFDTYFEIIVVADILFINFLFRALDQFYTEKLEIRLSVYDNWFPWVSVLIFKCNIH